MKYYSYNGYNMNRNLFNLNIPFLLVNLLISVCARPQDLQKNFTSKVLDLSFPVVTLAQSRETLAGSILNSPTQEKFLGRNINQWDGPIRRCENSNENSLNTCLRLILSDLKPRLADGIPEINLPQMDPLRLKNVQFQHGSGPIKLIAAFSNVEATGLSHYNQSEFTVDMERKYLNFDMGIPQMQIIGNYELSGNLFFFPIGGTGNFWLHLIGVNPRGRGNLEILQNENGQKVLQLRSVDLDLNIESLKVHLTNLFNGDKLLGNVMNNFLNENSMEIFSELRPQIGRRVGEMVKVLTNRALGALSFEFFQDLPPTMQRASAEKIITS